ncbi:AMP-binding protein [Kiritimatiellota bacterium B12222]|nr:AMP-binding protein [Kiritimatiellota bacterium B12222]
MRCPLRAKALQYPDRSFLISASESISFLEADLRCAGYQAALADAGFLPGSRFPILLPVSPDAVCLLFACLRQKITLCPINLRLPEGRIQELLGFLDSENLYRELPTLGNEYVGDAEVDPAQMATLLFTSGSSGRPKLVPHRLDHHLSSAFSANAFAPLTADDRWLCSLPFYHVGGLAILFRCVLAGAAVAFPEAGQGLVASIRSLSPTHLSLVPTQLIRLLREGTPEGLKRILLGGAPVPERLIAQAKSAGLPLATSYGMTETASQIASTLPEEEVKGAGRVMPHAEVKISAEGEIWIKGDSVSDAFVDAEGWLHSGDRGRVEEGVLYVEGRMDRQFISGGENIQPEQIEQALMNLPGISQAVVRPQDDEEFGQRPVAWVDAEWQEEWEQELRSVLPGYMLPVRYEKLPDGVGLKPTLKALVKSKPEGKS